ncbi:hypothetical protein M9H77_31492 [Catharanthus roseus]|uniref:Uncharacterized protein n=1 Tax=Catharanthus roseus TaxID=4058 RepID=A0ACC0A243_CATRO|nr:hypothetical protein M9H77_31492 [Catharanthus roseus]
MVYGFSFKPTLSEAKDLGDQGKMKEKRPSLSKIKSLKTLKTYVLVREVLRMRPNLSVSKSLVRRILCLRCVYVLDACPKESHSIAVKCILRYLISSYDYGLWYSKQSSFDLIAYTDADYAGCKVEKNSTSSNCQFLGGCLISWYSKKQSCVSLSTAEAEYIAAGCCCAQSSSYLFCSYRNFQKSDASIKNRTSGFKIRLKDFLHKNSRDIQTTKPDDFDKNWTSDFAF